MKTRGSWRSRNPTLAIVLAAAIAAFLVGFGAYGVLRDDLAVPASTRYGLTRHDYHFHGETAWLMFAGFACLGASIVLVIARRGRTDRRVPLIIGIAGAAIILTMMILKWVDLV
jgi:hypothetical protein